MKNISALIERKEYLPVTEDIQQELVAMFNERRIKQDSLIKNFVKEMLFGATSALIVVPLMQLIPKRKSIDWKVYIVAHLVLAMVCSSVIKCFFKGLPRSNP